MCPGERMYFYVYIPSMDKNNVFGSHCPRELLLKVFLDGHISVPKRPISPPVLQDQLKGVLHFVQSLSIFKGPLKQIAKCIPTFTPSIVL